MRLQLAQGLNNLTTSQRIVVAVAAVFTVSSLGYLLFGSYGDAAAAMSVFHIGASLLSPPRSANYRPCPPSPPHTSAV